MKSATHVEQHPAAISSRKEAATAAVAATPPTPAAAGAGVSVGAILNTTKLN